MYASFAFHVNAELILIQAGKMKSPRYGLLTELALLVECLAPWQNCIKCIICMVNSSKKAIRTPIL